MKSKTKLESYECCDCGQTQMQVTEQCPVLFIDIINPPTTCACGSHDFIAHVSQHIQIHKPLEFINLSIKIDRSKLNSDLSRPM